MFDPAVFAARRDAYMQAIGRDAVAVVRSLPERLRNGDSFHPFRQISDLLYLTGFVEPDTTLVLRPGADKDRVVMFVRPRDPEMETWDGKRAGIDGAMSQYGADAAYPSSELPAKLGELIANCEQLYYAVGLDDDMDKLVMQAIARLRKTERRGKRPPLSIVDPRMHLHELRLHKRPEEIAALRKAAEISTEAHVLAMRAGKAGVGEHELEALINYTFRRHGGAGPGYATIVGAGANATILHYIENRRRLVDGDLVLVDAGCELEGYASDITRTTVFGKPTQRQRDVWEIEKRAQSAALAAAQVGAPCEAVDAAARKVITAAGFGPDYKVPGLPHRTGHGIGLDGHEWTNFVRGNTTKLQPGMCFSDEPTIVIYGEFGIRLEDCLHITENGPKMFTPQSPSIEKPV